LAVLVLAIKLLGIALPHWLLSALMVKMTSLGYMIWMAIITVLIVIGMVILNRMYDDRKSSKPYQPSAIAIMYKHWKEKTCAKITWIEK
jgi:glycerol-3-phosphate acyltransferase PlsY